MPNEDVWVQIEFLEELDEDENGTGKVSLMIGDNQTITGEYSVHSGLGSGEWDRIFENNSRFNDYQAMLLLAVAANFYKDRGNRTIWDEYWQYVFSSASPLSAAQKDSFKTVDPFLHQV